MESRAKNLEEGEINSGDDLDLTILDNDDDVDRIIAEIKQSVLNNKDVDWRIPVLDEEMRKLQDAGLFWPAHQPGTSKNLREDGEISSDEGHSKRDVWSSNEPVTQNLKLRYSPIKWSNNFSNANHPPHYRNRKRMHNELVESNVAKEDSNWRSTFSPLPPPPMPPAMLPPVTKESVLSTTDLIIDPVRSAIESVSWRNPVIALDKNPSFATINNALVDNFDEVNMEISNSGNSDTEEPISSASNLDKNQTDEADALRALLLSQVKRKQTEKITNGPSTSKTQDILTALNLQDIQTPESPLQNMTGVNEETILHDRESEFGDYSEYQVDFGRLNDSIDEQLNDVDEIKRSLDFHRKKYEVNLKRKNRLQESLRLCEKAMDEHHGEILRLSQKLARHAKDTLKDRKSEMNKAEQAQEWMAKKIDKLQKQKESSDQINGAKNETTLIIPLEPQTNRVQETAMTEESSEAATQLFIQETTLTLDNDESVSPDQNSLMRETNEVIEAPESSNLKEQPISDQLDLVADDELEAKLLNRIMSRNHLRKNGFPEKVANNQSDDQEANDVKPASRLTATEIRSQAVGRRMNPEIPLCYYQLHGRCADPNCPWQHERDFLLTDQKILRGILKLSLKKCPNNLSHSEFASKLLDEDTLETILDKLYKKIIDLPTRIEYYLDSLKPTRKSIPPSVDKNIKQHTLEQRKS